MILDQLASIWSLKLFIIFLLISIFISSLLYKKILKYFEMQQVKGIDTLIIKQNILVYANQRNKANNFTVT